MSKKCQEMSLPVLDCGCRYTGSTAAICQGRDARTQIDEACRHFLNELTTAVAILQSTRWRTFATWPAPSVGLNLILRNRITSAAAAADMMTQGRSRREKMQTTKFLMQSFVYEPPHVDLKNAEMKILNKKLKK